MGAFVPVWGLVSFFSFHGVAVEEFFKTDLFVVGGVGSWDFVELTVAPWQRLYGSFEAISFDPKGWEGVVRRGGSRSRGRSGVTVVGGKGAGVIISVGMVQGGEGGRRSSSV